MLAKFSVILALLALNVANASMLRIPRLLVPRQAPGTPSGKAPGTQFITGNCSSDKDCQSDCCGFTTGKCAGAIVAQERDGGCGFGDGVPNDRAARVLRGQAPAAPQAPAPPQAPTPPAGNNGGAGTGAGTGVGNGAPGSPGTPSGKPPGTQFITGNCARDTDCASDCCGFRTGKCAGAIVAQERDGGCGFGDGVPNDRAARVLRGQSPAPAPPQAPAPPPANNGGAGTAVGNGAPGSPGTPSGKAPGTQFITGNCSGDKDCASDCCGFKSGKCAGPVIAQERDGGCGFGDAAPNDRAARVFRGQARR